MMMDVLSSNIVTPTVIVVLVFISSTYFVVAGNYHHGILSLIMKQVVVSYRTSGILHTLGRLLYGRSPLMDKPFYHSNLVNFIHKLVLLRL